MAMKGSEVMGRMPAWSDSFVNRLGAMKFNGRLPVVATVLMVLLLAQSLAMLTWELLPQPEVEESKSTFMPGNGTTSDKGRRYKNQINQISQWHLFGETQKKAPIAI